MLLRETSQCKKILDALADARVSGRNDGWVAMPELVAVSGSFNIHSRVDELRSKHHVAIENSTDVSIRPHISKYRLFFMDTAREVVAARLEEATSVPAIQTITSNQ